MSLGKALYGIDSTFGWSDDSNRWQLDSKTEKVPLLFLVEIP